MVAIKFYYRKTVTSFFVLMVTTACSGTPPESIPLEERLAARGYTIERPVKRLNNYRINGWSNVDRRNVILNVGASEHYLVTVRNPCDGLFSAEHLAFSTIIGDLTDTDKLIVRGPGRFLEYCYIDTIRTLDRIKQK